MFIYQIDLLNRKARVQKINSNQRFTLKEGSFKGSPLTMFKVIVKLSIIGAKIEFTDLGK